MERQPTTLTSEPTVEPHFQLRRKGIIANTFADDVRRGLTSRPKSILPQYFYDALGSTLFEAICELPEYYVTRAEAEIFTLYGEQIVRAIGAVDRVIELGSGSARKTQLLLDAMLKRDREYPLEYVPIDIDPSILQSSGRELAALFPSLEINAVAGDLRDPAAVMPRRNGRTVVLFLGSSIGNFDPNDAAAMLRRVRSTLAPGDLLLLGVDLQKPRTILEPAYDDALGVTAAFNRNLLVRINRELGGQFDLARFRHLALYNEEKWRIEMHLVSNRAQTVRIDALDLVVSFTQGETIHTENSYKYADPMLARLASAAGFSITQRWSDARSWFADILLVAQ